MGKFWKKWQLQGDFGPSIHATIPNYIRLGYNYMYRRHEGVTTVKLRNHEYRDMTHSSVEEFDSTSFEGIEKVFGKGTKLWICETSCRSEILRPKSLS